MATLSAEAINALRQGWLLFRTDHPRYTHLEFWCTVWPKHEEEGEPGADP